MVVVGILHRNTVQLNFLYLWFRIIINIIIALNKNNNMNQNLFINCAKMYEHKWKNNELNLFKLHENYVFHVSKSKYMFCEFN